ncbi:ABC transporter permease [Paenibacillus sp. MY03]|jgi:multiple sugar transport system permease protein|uniref:carbohydrate ABC transporter permease n=1 Tax=Paenibacillus sp. MY03 TaxID=302980 RepID=UPI000B3C52AC|nr:carbohydrate ABC transporter permease [Paenibacillus sp. MY03]OUS78110.1 ABC transporter permease [Paenibacillus sp. MY03]
MKDATSGKIRLETLYVSRSAVKLINVERQKRLLWWIVRTVLILGISFVILYPILRRISTALKDRADIYNPTVVWIPQTWTLDNFRISYEVMNYFQTLLDTLTLSGAIMIFQTVACLLAGFGFARLKFKGREILFACVIFTIVVPPQTVMVPTYLNFKDFDVFGFMHIVLGSGINLIDTYWPFILTSITASGLKTGLYIYIFRQFFRGLPVEIEEAALVDGASIYQTFLKIMVPNAIPSIVTVMLFSFVWQWNDSYYTSLYLVESKVMSTQLSSLAPNVGLYLSSQTGHTSGQLDPFYASMLVDSGVLLAILPLIVLYIFVQRYFVESVERTGLVG